MPINKFDIIILAPLLWGLYSGYRKGFIIEAASLVSLVIATWGGVKFSGYASELLTEEYGFETQFLPVISFLLVFLAILVGIHLLAKLIQGLLKLAMLGTVNRVFGALFSCLKYAVIVSVFIFMATSIIDEGDIITPIEKEETYLYQHVSKLSYTLVPALKEQVTELKETYKDRFKELVEE
ncbi:MAG: CvpA family protein [Bacteroidetes bacterium]|nr:CvpA family protein [Bacteroidota bacterium]